MKFSLRLRFIFFILFSLFAFSPSSFATPDPARFLVHLLDYLAKDYAGAVSQGKVTSQSEYQEQVEFSESALKTFQEIKKESPPYQKIESKLKELNHLINQKEDPQKVNQLARELQKEVTSLYQLSVAPSEWPTLSHGKKLYVENCISCHGINGDGNGPLANTLNPKPANFLDSDRMNPLSPFHVFNAIRLGIPGTAMVGFEKFSDQEAWNLAFYVISLRHQPKANKTENITPQGPGGNALLTTLASFSDQDLMSSYLKGPIEEKEKKLQSLRLLANENLNADSISVARTYLDQAIQFQKEKKQDLAKHQALLAYLEGIEPIEPRLKAINPPLVKELEENMAKFRQLIEKKSPPEEIEEFRIKLEKTFKKVELSLNEKSASPWFIFFMANSILLREGFEAILVIIAILGVVRASKSNRGALWVHAGWISAVFLGILAWFFSGWLMNISGATRELMEGSISLFAVIVLLYVGFWLHHKTEITRWTNFVDVKVKTALASKSLIGLALISFTAVFREAFETVLFLRSLSLEGKTTSNLALLGGVLTSFLLVLLLAFALLKLSAKIPLRKIFSISSGLIVFLALILTGKGFKALQETGIVSITSFPFSFRNDLLGIYPTLETLLPQAALLLFILILWNYSKKSTPRKKAY